MEPTVATQAGWLADVILFLVDHAVVALAVLALGLTNDVKQALSVRSEAKRKQAEAMGRAKNGEARTAAGEHSWWPKAVLHALPYLVTGLLGPGLSVFDAEGVTVWDAIVVSLAIGAVSSHAVKLKRDGLPALAGVLAKRKEGA